MSRLGKFAVLIATFGFFTGFAGETCVESHERCSDMGWEPSVKKGLDALVARNCGNPDAYAVFDFDYTIALGDLTYTCLWRILETLDFRFGDFKACFAPGVPEDEQDEVAALGAIAEDLKAARSGNLTDDPRWRDFTFRYWKLYRRLYKRFGDAYGCEWRSRMFRGYEPQELAALARRAISGEMTRPGLRPDATVPSEKRGFVIAEEMRELIASLRAAGIDVYIVSGSDTALLRVAAGAEFGLGFPADHVFGRDSGVIAGRKHEFVRSRIAPRHHGTEPVLVAGDSMGDYAMLTEFKGLQTGLLFHRNWRERKMHDLAESASAANARILVQGRDETRGVFIRSNRSVFPSKPKARLGGDATAAVRAEVERQIAAGQIRGAVVASETIEPTAFGLQRFSKDPVAMNPAARFDLASVTKTFVAVLCARLAAQGKLDVDAPFTKYLQDHVLAKEPCDITVRDLAMHVGGFASERSYQKTGDYAECRRIAMGYRPVRPRLAKFEYSCLNFVYLGWIAENVTGLRLDQAVRTYVIDPLGMTDTSWGPVADDGRVVEMACIPDLEIGAITDAGARNVSPYPVGNAGLYSSAADMRKYVRAILARAVFEPKAYDLIFTCRFEKDGVRRSFGFDMSAKYRPAGLSDRTIGHTGWSGQSIVVDPKTVFCGVCLTSRTSDRKRYALCKSDRAKILSLMAE